MRCWKNNLACKGLSWDSNPVHTPNYPAIPVNMQEILVCLLLPGCVLCPEALEVNCTKVLPSWGFPAGSDSEEFACDAGDWVSIPGSGRFPQRRKWQPTEVFLPGESL